MHQLVARLLIADGTLVIYHCSKSLCVDSMFPNAFVGLSNVAKSVWFIYIQP